MRIVSFLFAVLLSCTLTFGSMESHAQGTAQSSFQTQVNINSASVAELMTLPGVGEERSAAIIKNRPFKHLDELISKKIMPPQLYEIVKDKIKIGDI